MKGEILSNYGPESKPGSKRADCGGVCEAKPVQNYAPPVGPKHITNTGVGLRGGTNHGKCGTQGKH